MLSYYENCPITRANMILINQYYWHYLRLTMVTMSKKTVFMNRFRENFISNSHHQSLRIKLKYFTEVALS